VNPQEVFAIRTDTEFKKKALDIFRLQARGNLIYKKYLEQLGVDPEEVQNIEQIPFLPIELFKTQKIVTEGIREPGNEAGSGFSGLGESAHPDRSSAFTRFMSSGTTGDRSEHYVSDLGLYENSFRRCFQIFYGDISMYTILAFLPSYYENKNSSLLFMVNDFIKNSKKEESRFYQPQEEGVLIDTIHKLRLERKKVILFGVSYALLDLSERHSVSFSGESTTTRKSSDYQSGLETDDFIIMETGGMKGRRKEMIREELHKILRKKFTVPRIHSEYGMTELLSQAYSTGDGIFRSPPWLKVLVRDPKDPFSFLSPGRTGAINVVDLANIHSCSFIATQDIGKIHQNASFEVLGRIDNSDLRGCNLLVN